MANKEQIAKIIALRGTGHNLEEISKSVKLSTSAVAYQLKKLKDQSENLDTMDIFDSIKQKIGTYGERYNGIPSGTKYVVNNEGVWWNFPTTGEKLRTTNSEKLQKIFLSFRGPGRARITDRGEILAYYNPDDSSEDLDIEDDSSLDRSVSNWVVIGNIDSDLDGQFPIIPELTNDPLEYKPGEIWRGPMDGMRYSTNGKEIFRSHPRTSRWSVHRKDSGLDRKIWSLFMELKDYEGGRFYITERGAVITNVSPESIEIDFDPSSKLWVSMSNEERQFLFQRLERTNTIPVFLGKHDGGIPLQRGRSIHDELSSEQISKISSIFSKGGKNK